ncbi:M15 family metallopeptidase [Nocardioides antri]|uniref:M15 family metallopeptidase n=1 Tax=Nocardioides antri TaxID=2607659 RepID=A0A5B1M1M4_9ACTN|nr:M15 family metallopeptidase [Nocardioides antri]KAA1426822.1 M15 family metallopeptidase [Nocardioides antri]
MGVAHRRARLAFVSAVVLLAAACSSPADPAEDETSGAASGTSSVPDGGGPSYAVHTVEPPGEFDRIEPDDMLLESTETIPDELIRRIRNIRLEGRRAVSAITPLSLSSFSLENRAYRIAAVDVEGYRRFAGPDDNGARFQEAWERVAGGEIAVLDALKGRIPLDKDDYLAVGSGEQTSPIHVGAWTSQVGTIDAVVNEAWGEALDFPENNALVISTGAYSPQAVKEKLEPLLEDNMAITDLDIVAQTGIDPGASRTALVIGTFAEAVGVYRYTPIGGGRVQPDPAWVREHIVTETVPILGRLTCNKYMMPQLREALLEVQTLGLAHEIKYHVGCYYPRFIAGSTTLSNHSFGLAIDINSLENQRGTVGEMHPTVVQIFKKWGFAWGGDWTWTDPMHFELERIVQPG